MHTWPSLTIAIIVRTKDRPHLLTRCLQSLAEQTRLPDEIIVVNDGGTAVAEVISLFPNLTIHLLTNATNQGRARAGNQGVQQAQSQVIGFLDDDDRLLPDHLQRLEQAMVQFDAKVAYAGCRLLQRDLLGDKIILQEQAIGQFNESFEAERLRYENYIPLINLLIDHELWEQVGGFDETFDIFEDWDVLLRLSQQTPFYHLNRITTEYAIWGTNQVTQASDKQRWLKAYRQMLSKHLLTWSPELQLTYLAEYWRVSQERRGILQESRQTQQQLELQLLQTHQTLAQVQSQLTQYQQAEWPRKYEQLQVKYEQLQTEWTGKYQKLSEEYTQSQTTWSHKYEQLHLEYTKLQADWVSKYQQLQTEYAKLQSDWVAKYQHLQADYAKLQADWTSKYQQLQADATTMQADWASKYQQLQVAWATKHEQAQADQVKQLAQAQMDWTKKYEQLQLDSKIKSTNLQTAYAQQESHFKQQQAELLQALTAAEQRYATLEAILQQAQQRASLGQASLHEMHKQIAIGLTQAAMTRILMAQPIIVYPLPTPPDTLRSNYERLVEWCEIRQQTWLKEKQQSTEMVQQLLADVQAELLSLQEESTWLRQALQNVTEKMLTSRWLRYSGQVKLLDQIHVMSRKLDTHLLNCLSVATPSPVVAEFVESIASTEVMMTLPPPRPLSGLAPSIITLAGDPAVSLKVMTHISERGNQAVAIGPHTVLVFTTYCTDNGFCRLDLAMATYMRMNTCHLRLLIRDYHHLDAPPLRVVYVNAIRVLDNLFHPISFDPIVDSAGKSYQIEIDSPNAEGDNALGVWCHDQSPAALTVADSTMVDSGQLPAILPCWLREGLFDTPLSSRIQDTQSRHWFAISGVSDILNLQIFLRRIDRLLTTAGTTGQVVIAGKLSAVVKTYCQTQWPMITLVDSSILSPWPELLTWVKSQWEQALTTGEGEAEESYLWLCEVQTLPPLDAITAVQAVFVDQPTAALLVPLQVQPSGKISAAYALIDQYGNLGHVPLGTPANHPYHGYRREVEATSNALVILKLSALAQVDSTALNRYQTAIYQVTDLIWQLKSQQLTAVYDSTVRYQDEKPFQPLTGPEYEQDRQLFCQRWQSSLLGQAELAGEALFNPKLLPTVLIVEATLPTYDEDSGSLRLFTLIKMLVQLGYKVTFFPDNLDSNVKYRQALEALGVEVFHGDYTLGDALSYRQFTFALVCRVEIGYRYLSFLRLMSPQTKIFYDTVDIHYIREQRQAEIENNPQLALKAQETKRKELSNCVLADCVLTVTEEDARHLQQELPKLNYAVLPNVHLAQPLAETTFAQREGLVFIGNYNHQPNEDAVYYFVEQVLPKIQAVLPQVCLYVVGSNLKETMKQWASDYVKIVGWVEQVAPAFAQRRVFVSYLRYGAGMKGKLGQALSLGLPVVTTSIGAEGMALIQGETALIADDPDQFAAAVCQLYTDEALWEKLARQGREYIEHRYGETAIREQLKMLLKPI